MTWFPGHMVDKEFKDLTGNLTGLADGRGALAALNISDVDRQRHRFTFTDGTDVPLSDLQRVIPCFTPGTRIATPKGEVAVERLKVGDRVLTRDNGIKTIRWFGQKKLDHLQLKTLKELRPVEIKAGALGGGQPERDMKVSPMHRLLVRSDVARAHFGQSEVFVAAIDLVKLDGISVAEVPYATYVHFMCDHHEVVLSDGTWSESFQPGDLSLKGMDQQQCEELFGLFPDLAAREGVTQYRPARRTLDRNEAALLFSL
ncbi:Hint domain-containing protein [Yoonia sp.]|uniref:Hint domain-containing protein n=1 Tax=Yoonia sp. TaxID=2212373 RepID=UPI002FD9A4F3